MMGLFTVGAEKIYRHRRRPPLVIFPTVVGTA
ncbi:hypothetical protein GA0070607_4675 [Micromonospora coriariae]|uniref:Uncharacterized protein n=1 Tax=Micromonospora coriariae TaxID=285665 RepID=A0A1C4X4V8_9ACTN|nr:hypothetical protein GA0070607_4675 [Micromonospora coriariae]